MLPCYPALHPDRPLSHLPMTLSTFTLPHAPTCHPFDLVDSGRRRKRHVLKPLVPPVSELARRVKALTIPFENEV